jgi:hypothetical protein
MAIDLPRQIIDATGVGQAGLGEPDDAEQLALDPAPSPAAGHRTGRNRGDGRSAEPRIALGIGIDDRLRAAGAFGAQFDRIGQRKGAAPPVERRFARDHAGGRQQGRRGARDRDHRPVCGGIVDRPHEPRRLRKPCPHRHVARFRSIEPVKIGFAEHRIFRDQPLVLERKDIRRDQPVGGRLPALGIGVAIVRYDQVEIEHQPVERAFAQAAAVK